MLVGAAIRRRDIESSDDVEPKLKLNPDCLLAETGPFVAKNPPPFACVAPPPLLVSPCCASAALSTSISACFVVYELKKLAGLSRSFEANSRITRQRRMYLDDHDWGTRRIANLRGACIVSIGRMGCCTRFDNDIQWSKTCMGVLKMIFGASCRSHKLVAKSKVVQRKVTSS